MRVFVTGANGFIGSAVVQELLGAGHEVVGLARDDKAREAVEKAGAEALIGDLSDLAGLAAGARSAEGVIHTAYIHDFSNLQKACEIDTAAVTAIAAALEGTGKPFVNTSGVAVLTAGKTGIETDEPDPDSAAKHRIPSELAGLASAAKGVRATAVRPGASVHDKGDHGFVGYLYGLARDKGVSAYVGDGANRWPAVHRLDAARLFRLALERGRAGARYHAVADTGVPFREIAEVLGRHLGVEVVSITPEQSQAHFGGFAGFVALDAPASSEITQHELGWRPEHPGLIADISRSDYFQA